eukprot:gnl/TRDRNA2_/TRDRNA2_92562_c0_seq2.p1 gnl/TRDRNA2_/TRDRNA2_92562_c0~~gnl/TRDRNA2_/TRDRNA2_92562_c0_seq2.p1  ORF type:complete len:173 (-),score=18.69 gnl/TRDRNA2_/TRDRNA2_92562_c0_seq2:29-493(-)
MSVHGSSTPTRHSAQISPSMTRGSSFRTAESAVSPSSFPANPSRSSHAREGSTVSVLPWADEEDAGVARPQPCCPKWMCCTCIATLAVCVLAAIAVIVDFYRHKAEANKAKRETNSVALLADILCSVDFLSLCSMQSRDCIQNAAAGCVAPSVH